MSELNSSMEEAELSKTLKKLEILEAEKGDIVLGFIKEKEIIAAIHKEQLQKLKVKHEDEIQALRQEWLEERKKLLLESDHRKMDSEFHNERKTKEMEEKLRKKSQEVVKETEEEFRMEKRKLREEYEAVISQKTSEIEELYHENCVLRSKSDPGSFEDKHKESEIMFNKLQSKISALEEEKLAQIKKLKNDFELEKAELERQQIREKAEFVKQLTSKYEQQNTNNEIEKNESFLAYKKEMNEKIEIVEKLWEERNAEDRRKMNTRLEKEIAMQKQRFADDLRAQLSEKDMEIKDLEREKEELSSSVHVERFELAKAYNRELSIHNRLDSPTKEDIEVALIDEVAKLRDEQQKTIRNLEKQHKRKMRDLKKSHKPLAEIEEQHKNELEDLRNSFEREKEELEAKLRNEQLNILKSFEFEKNDLERYYKQHMEEQESEFQNEIQVLQSEYDKLEDKIASLEKENEDLENQVAQEREKNGELFDKLQECECKNARLKEEIERDKRNMREPVKDISADENDNEGIKLTVEKLSSLNVQLSDELEKERKKFGNLLEKVHELEKERECLMTRSEADEVQSSESGLELFTSSAEKPGRSSRETENNTDSSSVEKKKSGEPQKTTEPNQEDLDMQMKLQDSVQECLLEIKVLQNAMDEKEMEIKQLKNTFAKEKSDLKGQIQDLTDSLKNVVDDEDGTDEEEDIEELKSRYKRLTDSINQVIKELADKPSSSEASQTSDPEIDPEHSGQQKCKGFANEVKALDEVLSDEMDPLVKERLGKKLEAIKNKIRRSHELEKLEQQRKHEQVKNRYLKELSDEKQKELDVTGEVWEAVCEKLGIDKEEGKDKLKEMLREKDVGNKNGLASQKIECETKSKPKEEENTNEMETKDEKCPNSEELKNLKEENGNLRRALEELDNHYEKDKEELMEKLQAQHKEVVLSSEAEVIEKLLKIKSALEEEAVIERFYLGRIYYMEMQDELEEILSQRKEDMNKEHEKEKLDAVLKFNKDIADLHKLLADKDENEVKLIQEKNALAKKVLDIQRRMPGNKKDETNSTDDIKAEAKKLEASLPLKKELADLQQQRLDEHEEGVQNLEKALDLIKDLLNDQDKVDDSLHRRYSFASAASQSDKCTRTESPTGQKSPTSVQESVLSNEEIRTKEALQKALEDLIDNCLSKEKDDAESDTSSGASSDFESEPNTPPCESEEGVSDSGAESIENECVSIKKADLELAMNLERFGLGRIYYNEFKDSLQSALKKLDKSKKMNKELEDKLSSGVKDLVNRTVFGKIMVPSVDRHTQTLEIDDPVKKITDDLSESDQKIIPLDTSTKVSEQGDAKEDKIDDTLSNTFTKDTVKKAVGTQTDELQDYTKTAEQTNERKDTDGKENMVQDSIKETNKNDATSQTDILHYDMEDAKEPNEENGVTDKHDVKIKDAIPQKQDDFPINEENKDKTQSEDVSSEASPRKEKGIADKQEDEIKDEICQKQDEFPDDEENNQKQSEHISSKALPQKEKDKRDEIVEPVCEPATSHMLGQEAPEKETLGKDEENAVDSKDKDTEKDGREQPFDGDEKPFDEDKESTSIEGKAKKEDATFDKKPEGIAEAEQSDPSDDQDQILKDQGRTRNEDTREELEVNDQPADKSDIEMLRRENEKLKDKFIILKALVGKWFVEEIPELRSLEKQKKEDSRSDDLGEDELKELREEEKGLADKITALKEEILQLKDMNDANNKKEEEKLNEQELLALKQLEKADKALKKEEEKDLIELLEKEKEEVGKKLKELEMELKEHEDQISDDEKRLFDLMSKKLELEEDVTLKARELEKNQKKLAQTQDDTEMAKLDEAVLSLTGQKKVLEGLLSSPLSSDAQEVKSKVSYGDKRKDEDEHNIFSANEAHISPHAKELVKTKNSKEKKMKNLAKNIEKAKRDKDRYNRMAKDREDRLRPFIKKREKLQKSLRDGERTAGEIDKVDVLSAREESVTPKEASSDEAMSVEDIERELTQIRDELSLLGKKAKIPLAVGSQTKALLSKLTELECGKNKVEQQITEKQSAIENLGSKEAAEVCDLLEAKAKLEVKRLDLQEAFPEGYIEIPQEVEEAYELSYLKQEIQNAIKALDQEIKDEENNFKEAVIYQRQGKLDDPHSTIGPILTRLQNLSLELEKISNSLPSEDEAELVSAEAAKTPEDASKRIKEIEDLLKQNEHSIKDEPLRAAGELGKLIESKQNKTDELLKVTDVLKEKIKMAELKENELQNIPESIQSAISLEKETDEEADFLFERIERENDIKERCLELQSLKGKGEDTQQKEDELVDVIEKQDPLLASDEKQANKEFNALPASVFADNKAITSDLENIEVKLGALLDGQSEKEDLMPEIDDLGSLFQNKAEIDQNIKYHEHFNDLVNQERNLAKALKIAVNKKELEEIEQIIERKEQEIEKIKAKSTEVEEMLEQLNDAKTNNEQSDDKLILDIQEAFKETEQRLLEAQAEKERYYQNNNQEEIILKEAMSSLEDEMEEKREETEFVENELEGLRSISEDGSAVSPELVELTKLLNSKKTLKDYLLEIDTKLEDCDDSAKPSLTPEEVQAFKDEKRDAKRKLKEIQEEKSMFEVELQDEDIQENYASLCEEKSRLEQAQNELLHKIHGSNVFVQMADELVEEEPSEEEQRYYTQALNQMLSDQKTLIKLAEENEKLKEATCRQRDRLENLNNSISASLGEDLAQAITLDANMEEKENIQLPTAIMDRINEKDKTIADVCIELENENKKLAALNEDLSNELNCLKEKTGETLSDAILQSNTQLLEEKLMPPIGEVMSADKTVEEILEEQKDALERLKDVIGEDLTDILLKPRKYISETDDQKEPLRAPKIMNETDEDLQTVIAAYEFKLDNLGKENDVLKNMLGNDLARALLDIDQDGIDKPFSVYEGVIAEKGKPRQEDGEGLDARQAYQKETMEGKQSPFVQDDYADENTKVESEARKQQLSTNLKPRERSKNADEIAVLANRGDMPKEAEGEGLQSSLIPVAPTTSQEMFSETSKSRKQAFPESDAKKHGFTAPARMTKDNKTLGEVIKDYENELDTLKFRLGPDLYKEIVDAGMLDKEGDGGDFLTEESEIESKESGKPLEGAAFYEEARKDSGSPKGDFSSDKEKGLRVQTRELCKKLEDKQEMMPSDTDSKEIEENVTKEKPKRNLAEDSKSDGSLFTEEKAFSAQVKEKGDKKAKPQTTALAAPKKMIAENQSLEEVIEGYENDLENLKSGLGQELFRDILDVAKQCDAPSGSKARSEDEEGNSYFEESGEIVVSQEEQDDIEGACESENTVEDLPPVEIEQHDLIGQRSKGGNQPDDLDQVQLAANAKEQAYELNETKPILDAENTSVSYVDDRKHKAPASLIEETESSELKGKSPSIAAPKRMLEKNQTLAKVVGGYENDLDILKSRLGPELYNKILDAGKIVNTDLQLPGTRTENLEDKEQPEIPVKSTVKIDDTVMKDIDKTESKESERMPYTGVSHSQNKTSKIDDSPTTESIDDGKVFVVSEETKDSKEEGIKDKQRRELAHKSSPLMRGSKAKPEKVEISAPKHMVEDNKTLEDVIRGYETDLEFLKSKLGPQLFTSLLGTRSLGDEQAKSESHDKAQRSKVFKEKQPSEIRNEESKIGNDLMEEVDYHDDVKENDQEKDLESNLSEGETYLSDGELYESFNIPNDEEKSTKYKPSVDDKLRFNAPTIMSKEGKTLGEVLESYEDDLKALRSKLGPKLFDHVLKIAKDDGVQATAGIEKEYYDSQMQIPTKELRTEELTEPVNEEKDNAVNIDYQRKGADNELKGGEKEHPRTGTHDDVELQEIEKDPDPEKGLQSKERSVVTSTDTDDSESLSTNYDLVAQKQMLEENKTLEEIIKNYENELRDLRESLGPQLCYAVLNARKGINESSDAAAMASEREDSETEKDYLKQTTDEKGQKAGSLKTELCRVVSGSYPQEAFKNVDDEAKDIGETSETSGHSKNQNEQKVQEEKGETTSGFDTDDQQRAKQDSTTQKLQAPKMIAQGKKLDEIVCGYENEIGALKSRIGPTLYKDIVNAGKPDRSYERERILDAKMMEDMDKIQALDEALKEMKDESTKEGFQEERYSANDVISKKTKGRTKEEISGEDPERDTKEGQEEYKTKEKRLSDESVEEETTDETKEVTSTEHHDDRNATEQKASKGQERDQEQEEDITSEENNIDGLQLKAAKVMLTQNKTLEEIVQGYEEDLATLNSKLGPKLYQHVLETGRKDDETKASDKESAFDYGLIELLQKTGKKVGSLEDNIRTDSKTEDVFQEGSDKQEQMIGKVAQKQAVETIPEKADVEKKSKTKKWAGDVQDSIDVHEKEMKSSQTKVPILLAEKGTTLQEIIEKYEKDLDAFSSRLGPNLTKAVVEDWGKEIKRKDDRDDLSIKKADDFNQEMKDEIGKTDSSEIRSNLDDATHDSPIAQDEVQSDDKNITRKAVDETEKRQEMDYYSEIFENNKTLEDALNELKKESENLKEKLGPNLTKILLDEQMEKLKDEEAEKKKENDSESGPKNTDSSHTVFEQQTGSPSSEKENEEMLHGEEDIGDTAQTREAKYEDGKKDDMFTENDVSSKFSSKQKTFMAPKLMEIQNAPLEDVIQNYEHDLSVLKKALGPNLVDLLLNDKATPTADTKPIVSDADEDKEMTKTAQDKEQTRRSVTESNRAKGTEVISEEQRQVDEEDKQEKMKNVGDQEENKDNEEEGFGQTEPFHESGELEKIVSPLLNGDENNSLEDILKTLHKDLDVLTSKLGNNLSKSLLTMDADSYDVAKEKYFSDSGGEEGKALEKKDEHESLCEKMEGGEDGKTVSELKVEEEEDVGIFGTESAVEEPDDLAALDQMEENSETLEEVIKKYESNLERYESSLGPHLSKAILTKEITPIKAAQESEAKPDLDHKNAQQDVPLIDEMKLSKLEEYLKLLDEGKTLEDVLIRYEPGDEVIITGESVPTSDQINRLQKQNSGLRQELDNLKSKLGETLVSQLQPKGLDAKTLEQREKETPQDDVAKTEDDKLCLEAPKIMAKDNRTLEDIVAEYENDLKEKTKIEEDLEQSIGPHLFKELCELRKQKGEKEDVVEEKIDSESEEGQENTPTDKREKLLQQLKYDAVNKMAEEKKTLEAVLEDNENDLKALERENESLKKALENVSGDGTHLGEIISKYENQITMLENEKKEAENDFEDKHNELQNEIDDLRATLEKLAQTLRQDFLDDLMRQDSDNHIEALQIMEKENKTLAEVVEEYEENMKNLEREKAVLQQIAGQDDEGASMLDTINDYEDAIKGLKEVNKVLNKRMDALTEKLGPQLTKQITDLCDEVKPSITGEKDDRTKDDKDKIGAVKEMEDKNVTLEELLKMYDDLNKREIVPFDRADQIKTFEKGDKEVKELDEVNNNEDRRKQTETLSTLQTEDVAAGLMSEGLCERIGLQLIGDIKQLDSKTYEELEKEDKRPYALRTMKAKNENLEDVIEAYENTLSTYGLLDSSTLKGESLAVELQDAIEDDIKVEEQVLFGGQATCELAIESRKEEENADPQGNDDDLQMKMPKKELEEVLFGEQASSDIVNKSKKDEENSDAQGDDDGQQMKMLKKELEEEKALKEKYQKDAEDLLNDIIKLKMKNADGEDVDNEDMEKQIKEEYEQKQENKHLKEELSKEKEKNKDLENENNELEDEIRNMRKEMKNLEKAIEKMQASARGLHDGDVDGRIKELLVKNENLEKELEALKNQLKENEGNYKNEKNNLMDHFENEKRDTIKSLLEAKAEVEIKLQEQLELYHELEEKLKNTQEELDRLRPKDSKQVAGNKETEETSEENEDKLAELRMRNESLKETLDLSEESMKDALQKYQEEIKALELGKAKIEDDKNHEIELLNTKLELEKAALERLKNDYDEMLKKENERQREDFEKDLEREKRRSQKDLEEQSKDYERKQNVHKQEVKDANNMAEKEKEELRNSLQNEMEKLKKIFEEQMRQKEEEHEKVLNKLREQLEDQMITEKAEMNVQFRQEKTELKTQIEKNIYGEELQKNIDLENDFQETLNKVLKDHANEIAEIEKQMAQTEERFRDQKLQLLEEFENEKLEETKQHEKEKREMESTIENLLKEIIKLKHQRKEMRQQYRVEKQSIEEISEKERNDIQENMERSKNEFVTKLKEDHEKEMESEKEKYEAVIKELQEALDRAEAKKKELEEKLRNESLKAEENLNNRSVDEASSREITREVKVIKRGIEIEYEQKLSIEKQRFEDTLQGLRREVGNLQEKRKIIQERVYNQETHSTERQFIEKSIANYKLEVLSKLEADMAHRIERERKPLEEEVRELQIENEELKRQRWELKAQFRREKAALEEEFEREKEALENTLNKEKEELRKRLEVKLQKEKQNKAFDHVRVSRSTSPVPGESSPRIDNTVRMLKQENLSLVSQNAKHEIEIEQLSEKLKFMEMNFQEMMETEKLKAEKMKKIQEQIPKVETVDPTLPAPEYKPPSTGTHDDTILNSLQEKDQQIHQLLETKKYYESVLSELCDEAGLFELDRNQIV